MAKFSSYSSFALIFVVSLMFIGSTEIDARRLGGQKCTWGPSYWCKNIRQASAVSNCQVHFFIFMLDYIKFVNLTKFMGGIFLGIKLSHFFIDSARQRLIA